MRYWLPLGLILLASSAFPDTNRKLLTLHKVPSEVVIDGIIDPTWSSADSTDGFFQLQPYYNQPPSYQTVAKLLTTDENLYCLMICYEQKKDIQEQTGVHDEGGGDIVSLMLDTFGDKQTAYKFAVSASGVRADSRLLDDARNRDYSWDGVWFSAAKTYDWGYVVEMRIPYKSIRYNGTLREWGLDFDRWIGAKQEDLYWCSYERNEGQRISKFGRLALNGARPVVEGLNLEVYPVAIGRASMRDDGSYKLDPDAGLDIFYNPSERLTLQLTANPDFAQIEADPYEFNVSRYETYFAERRPFFTEGSEIFTASGRQQNTGFYRPLDLFYSRRIGKGLPDGKLVPLQVGTKLFGRMDTWEYGGFFAMTGSREYEDDGVNMTESHALFGAARIKRTILDNSSLGVLFVGKRTAENTNGVVDVDGAFRTTTWQLSYQLARSIQNSTGDFAGSAGFVMFGNTWANLIRTRLIGNEFDVDEVGFVPWKGTAELTGVSGPVWNFDEGYIRQMFLYGGASIVYEDADLFTDWVGVLGFNMQLRDNWGYEITLVGGRSKDQEELYTSYQINLNSWWSVSPLWHASFWTSYSQAYNFSREYLAPVYQFGSEFEWKALNTFELGTSFGMLIEWKPEGGIEDVTYNARPYVSFTPVNDLNLRVYMDNLFLRSSDQLERVIVGVLFSYQFLPKSRIYFAFNEVQDHSEEYDAAGSLLPLRMHTTDRAAVLKVKYLYYF